MKGKNAFEALRPSPMPWRVLDDGRRKVVVDAKNNFVALLTGNPEGRDAANAAIMEAAPAMLAILQRIVGYDWRGNAAGAYGYDGCYDDIMAVLGQLGQLESRKGGRR